MTEIILILTPLFLGIAFVYSSVGLAGGSAYLALLTLVGSSGTARDLISHQQIPTIALLLNLIVSSQGAYQFWRAGHFQWQKFVLLFAASVPMAFVGGLVPLSRTLFAILVAFALVCAALRLLLISHKQKQPFFFGNNLYLSGISVAIGAGLGFLSGLIGIGGGIFLSPLLLLSGLCTPKQTAALSAMFIFCNSASGLLARSIKQLPDYSFALPLAGAVLVGGFLGAHQGARHWSPLTIQKISGGVLLVAAIIIGGRAL